MSIFHTLHDVYDVHISVHLYTLNTTCEYIHVYISDHRYTLDIELKPFDVDMCSYNKSLKKSRSHRETRGYVLVPSEGKLFNHVVHLICFYNIGAPIFLWHTFRNTFLRIVCSLTLFFLKIGWLIVP